MYIKRVLLAGLLVCASSAVVRGQNITITIPRHSELTPVQRLNRQGVDAVLKHRYEAAEALFYKAYLFDPADPFTLNNLGYVSELHGNVDRAEKFYELAVQHGCYAIIDRSSAKRLDGRPMMDALGTLQNIPMRVNRINVLGMQLLSQQRNFEAESLFKAALAMDPHDAFTLNNLGVAQEATGDLDGALVSYDGAAALRSTQPVVLTVNRSWIGKPVSEMAAESARDLRKRMQNMNPAEIRATMLTIRGVSATNKNDWSAAKQDFLEAYSLNPESAFALNNLGYVSERDGDPETARAYYARARRAGDAGTRVGLATQSSAQGQQLAMVADESHRDVQAELIASSEKRRGQKGPIELKRRNNQTQDPGTSPPKPASDTSSPDSSPQKPGE